MQGGVEVELVCWPDDAVLRHQLAASRLPRLLLVQEGHAPPLVQDELEDWVRFPLDPEELTIRSDTLLGRARGVPRRMRGLVLDGDGVLRRGENWVALSPTEARVF